MNIETEKYCLTLGLPTKRVKEIKTEDVLCEPIDIKIDDEGNFEGGTSVLYHSMFQRSSREGCINNNKQNMESLRSSKLLVA